MPTLFLDTETTGMYDFKSHFTAKNQPHICQIAALLDDEDRDEVASISLLINPSGWTFDPEAVSVHGITLEKAMECGVSLALACQIFNALLQKSDRLVAHNLKFDLQVMASQFAKVGQTFDTGSRKGYCTMLASTTICKLPSTRYNQYKWPKLAEAYQILCGEELIGAHDALADVRACKEIYYQLIDAGVECPWS